MPLNLQHVCVCVCMCVFVCVCVCDDIVLGGGSGLRRKL